MTQDHRPARSDVPHRTRARETCSRLSSSVLYRRISRASETDGRGRRGMGDAGSALPNPVTTRRWRLLTLISSAATGAVLALAPVVRTSSCFASSSGSGSCSSSSQSLVASEGGGVLAVLAVPALLAVVPLLLPWRQATFAVAVAMTAIALLALASVGLFLVPTVAVAWIAAAASRGEASEQAIPGI